MIESISVLFCSFCRLLEVMSLGTASLRLMAISRNMHFAQLRAILVSALQLDEAHLFRFVFWVRHSVLCKLHCEDGPSQ